MGPSGTGKSSLFRMMNLLRSPDVGEIYYCSRNVLEYKPSLLRREVGYVMQKPYLFGKTAEEDLVYPYQLRKQQPNLTEIKTYLAKVNLTEAVLDKRPGELSGGEQQRIALIRSLLVKPRVLLLDEVTASLDETNTAVIEDLLLAEQAEKNLTLLFITHNMEQARRISKKVLYLEAGAVKYYGATAKFFARQGGE
jgi:putative ABC transport system ATP-binding protein